MQNAFLEFNDLSGVARTKILVFLETTKIEAP